MVQQAEHQSNTKQEVQKGKLMLISAMLMLPGIDAIAKGMSDHISPGQLVWARFFFQTLLLLPFAIKTNSLKTSKLLWVHATRGFLIALATLFFFASLAKLPMADAISIFFVGPLILTLLSALVLHERVGFRRISAVAAGFLGSIIIIRPSYEIFGVTALLPVGAACAFSVYIILTRILVRDDNAITIQFSAGIFGCITMTLALLYGNNAEIGFLTPIWPSGLQWLFLAGLGIIATAGHMLIVLSIKRIGASLMAPFQYLEIVSATILGLICFGDFPDALTWLGMAIIVSSGLYVYYRERELEDSK